MKLPRASLAALITAQAQETFNDCAAKFMLIALTQQLARAHGDDPKPVVSLIMGMLILPYVLFGPVCGWLADRFPKRTVLNRVLIAQIGVMAALGLALLLKSFWGAMVCFFFLSVVMAVLSPAKRGILLEYVGPGHLSRFVGYMEMFNNLVEDWCREELEVSFAEMHIVRGWGLATAHLEANFAAHDI